MNECRFELKQLHCRECGAYLNEEGTCEDEERAVCRKCGYDEQGRRGVDADAIWQPDYDNLDKKGEPKVFKPMRVGKGRKTK